MHKFAEFRATHDHPGDPIGGVSHYWISRF